MTREIYNHIYHQHVDFVVNSTTIVIEYPDDDPHIEIITKELSNYTDTRGQQVIYETDTRKKTENCIGRT